MSQQHPQSLQDKAETWERVSIIKSNSPKRSAVHNNPHNAFIRLCDEHTLKFYFSYISMLIILLLIEVGLFSTIQEIQFGSKTSSLRLASGSGAVARINTLLVDLPYAECTGYVSSFPNNIDSANLLGMESISDDFSDVEGCKFVTNDFATVDDMSADFENSSLVGVCNTPYIQNGISEDVAIVFEGANLLSVESLLLMCDTDNVVRTYDNYDSDQCRLQIASGLALACCPSRNIGNYVAALANLSTCRDITEDSVSYVTSAIETCKPYYMNGKLSGDCWDWVSGTVLLSQCPSVPYECARYNAMYDMLHNLMAAPFASDTSSSLPLNIAQLLVPLKAYSGDDKKDWVSRLYYEELRSYATNTGGVVGVNVKSKGLVFEKDLSTDAFLIFPIFAASVLGCMAFGTSAFVALSAVISIFLSFGVVMLVVDSVMGVTYFPFFNITTLCIMLYVGLVSLMLFVAMWQDSFRTLGPLLSLRDRLSIVWHRRFLVTFVSGISSSCCFFTAILFPFPSIKIFGLFSGISLLCVLLLSSCFFPVVVLLDHKYRGHSRLFSTFSVSFSQELQSSARRFLAPSPSTDSNLKYFKGGVTFTCLVLGILSIIKTATINGSEAGSTQLLPRQHTFERYSLDYANAFFNSNKCETSNYDVGVVFGVLKGNNVKRFNPTKRQISEFYQLNVSDVREQQFLYDMCVDMLGKYADTNIEISIQNVACYPIFFSQWMQVPCEDTKNMPQADTVSYTTPQRTSCCGYGDSEVVYSASEFDSCIVDWALQYGSFETGLWFGNDNSISAVTISFQSNIRFSSDYSKTKDFWNELSDYTSHYLDGAPEGSTLKKGFFSSTLETLRFQIAISNGLLYSLPLCQLMGALVVLCMTRNIVSAAINILTATFSVYAVGAVVKLGGYEVNILVSIVLIIASGLAGFSSSLMSQTIFENSGPFLSNDQAGVEAFHELMPAHIFSTLTLIAVGICILGSKTYFIFHFGVFFVLICLFGFWFNLVFHLAVAMLCGSRQPIRSMFVLCGASPPPCCMGDDDPRGGGSRATLADQKDAAKQTTTTNPITVDI